MPCTFHFLVTSCGNLQDRLDPGFPLCVSDVHASFQSVVAFAPLLHLHV